jgi:hypothetical protein
MTQDPILPTSLLERVREGMTVVDASGKHLGLVARVQQGDPQAATTRGEQPLVGDPGVIATPSTGTGGALGVGIAAPRLGEQPLGPDVPDQLSRELFRTGFVEVDGPDLHGPARYVPGDRIAEVTGDTLRLQPIGTAPPVTATVTPVGGQRPSEPVLRTYLGTPREAGRQLPAPVVAAAVLTVGLGGALVGWIVWRRRQVQRRPLQRLRHAGLDLADAVADSGSARVGILGLALLLLLLQPRRPRRPAPDSE